MTTPLDEYPRVRLAVYNAFWLIGVLLGAIQIGYASAGVHEPNPTWLTVALSIYPFLGGAVGYTAAANTPKQS